MGPEDKAAIVLFGAEPLVERSMVSHGGLEDVTSVPPTHQTDLEAAIRLGTALVPAGMARRIVIISDGLPTLGDAESAVRVARAQSIQVSVVPLEAPLGSEAWLAEVRVPDRLHEGEEFVQDDLRHHLQETLDMGRDHFVEFVYRDTNPLTGDMTDRVAQTCHMIRDLTGHPEGTRGGH